MIYRVMKETDIAPIAAFYMDYYNNHEGGCWTQETTTKRIHQVWSREDSFCLVLEEHSQIIAFAMGYFEQYDDCFAYDLVEIVVAGGWQGRGVGSAFMEELARQVKEKGAMLIQLEAVNDERHHHFYDKLGYGTAKNFVLKTKIL